MLAHNEWLDRKWLLLLISELYVIDNMKTGTCKCWCFVQLAILLKHNIFSTNWPHCLSISIILFIFAETIYKEDNSLSPTAEPYSTDTTVLKDNHPLMIMVEAGQEDLLAHPLVASLLNHKWISYGRLAFYFKFVVHLIYLFFLTGYLIATDAPFHNYM